MRVEFLVPRVGPQSDDPRTIPQLGITAMSLRHMNVLIEHKMQAKEGKITVHVPHPLAFALHKLFISQRRREKGKALRDKEMAYRIIDAAQASCKLTSLKNIWESCTNKEQTTIRKVLKSENRKDYLDMIDAF